ncbi:unnamed protein product [Gordionus sp. m RMFG-2023]|uniref:transmembrane protein 14C-like n=1 Tax=Gordionus sp. m RMFG-2023 TaxID=3053472 RepID=UPI0030DDEF57
MENIQKYKIDYFGYCYAGIVLTGGIAGYLKAGSPVSLAAGILFGSVLTYGAYLASKNPSNYQLIFGTSVALTALMGHRFYKTGKFMPAGLIAGMSIAMALRYGLRLMNNNK